MWPECQGFYNISVIRLSDHNAEWGIFHHLAGYSQADYEIRSAQCLQVSRHRSDFFPADILFRNVPNSWLFQIHHNNLSWRAAGWRCRPDLPARLRHPRILVPVPGQRKYCGLGCVQKIDHLPAGPWLHFLPGRLLRRLLKSVSFHMCLFFLI